jgi:hypothetical protein
MLLAFRESIIDLQLADSQLLRVEICKDADAAALFDCCRVSYLSGLFIDSGNIAGVVETSPDHETSSNHPWYHGAVSLYK